MLSIYLLAVTLVMVFDGCYSRNSYVILLPKQMRYGDYPVSITYLNAAGADDKVTGEVKITDRSSREQVAFQRYQLSADTCTTPLCSLSTIVNVQIEPKTAKNSYQVEVTGTASNGDQFKESASVTFKRKPLSVFIQTDRAVYKPSQTVNFRVVTVDTELKPKPVVLNVVIQDVKNNIVKQWQNQSEQVPGMFTGKFLLSDEPMNGDWKIKISTENEKTEVEKTFEVREYALPRFEVTLAPPGYLLTGMTEFRVTVTAKYTYGKAVKGACHVRIHQKRYEWEKALTDQIYLNDLTNGKVEFLIDLRDKPKSRRDVELSATCVENLTDKEITVNKSIPVYSQKYKVEFMKQTPGNFKPGMMYKAYVLLTEADGSPPKLSDLIYQDSTGKTLKRKMNLDVKERTFFYSPRLLAEMTADIDSAGVAVFEMKMDEGWSDKALTLEASFSDGRYRASDRKTVEAFFTRDRANIQVSPLGSASAIKVGEPAKFMIKTSFPTSELHIVLFSRGKIVLTEDLRLTEDLEHIYELKISRDIGRSLSPDCQLIVWTLTDNNELIADSNRISVDGAFSHQLQVSITPRDRQEVTSTVRPGDQVNVNVKAAPMSYFGVLVVDSASRLLGSNDITQRQVLSVLENQNDYSDCIDNGDYFFEEDYIIPPFYYQSCGARNSKEIFQNSGLYIKGDVYITDVHMTQPPISFPTTTAMLWATESMAKVGQPQTSTSRTVPPEQPAISDERRLAEVKRIRKDFPETWIFLDGRVNSNGMFRQASTVPDSITTWVATAFSLHPETGLDVVDKPFQLQAFKPFFVTLDLPYSIIRGEDFELKIIVQNYQKTSVNVRITLEKSKDYFKIAAPCGKKYQFAKVWTDIEVPSGDGYTVSLWIKPVTLGTIPIEVWAQSSLMADAVRRTVIVKPEGAPEEYTRNLLIRSKDISDMKEKVVIQLPAEDLVADSLRVYASLVGDVMGPAMNNLDRLIRMPYGCGEQNMLNFAPNIFIMNYLKATGQSNPEVVEKALTFTESGYQRELNYQRQDGCFSAFGDSDKQGSTWLTAFVLKSFWQGRYYLSQPVDGDAEKALTCLLRTQQKSGQFAEYGVIYHKTMQGGATSDLTLTAYVLIALLEVKDMKMKSELASKYNSSVDLALNYLVSKLGDPDIQTDPYSLAVIGYALSLANQEQVKSVFDDLEKLAKREAGQVYWDDDDQSTSTSSSSFYYKASSNKVETASYALLMYIRLGKHLDGLSIADWLIGQRNPNGGYRSTQDTIMALQALAEIAMKVYGEGEPLMDVRIKYQDKQWSFPKQLNAHTRLLLQTLELNLPEQERSEVEVIAKGKGTALVQITVKYNIQQLKDNKQIKINVTSDNITDFTICVSYHGDGESGMVVMETFPLSGYRFVDLDAVLLLDDGPKRVEDNQDKAVVYLDKVDKDGVCVPLPQERVNFVANIKKTRALAYSYYDADQADSTFYLPQALSGLDKYQICPTCCSTKDRHVLHFVVDDVVSGVKRILPVAEVINIMAVYALIVNIVN